MPLLVHVKRNQSYNWVIEDPDNRYGRIFVENQALNVNDLTPRPGESFWHSDNTWNTTTTAAADWKDWPVVMTLGKFGNSWADSRQAWPAGIGRWDPWLLFLDYNFTPQKIIYASTADRWYMFYPRDITTDNMRQDVWVGENLNTFAQTRTTTQNDWTTPIRLREDGNWIGLNQDNNTTAVVLMRMDPAGLTTYNIRTTTNIIHFYMGSDYFGTDYFLEVNCNTHEYSVIRIGNPSFTGSAVSTSTSTILTGITGGYTGVIYQFPSNFVNTNNYYCTFYSSHYNASGILEPRKFTWNKLTGQVTSTTCSVAYPGSDTFSTYGQVASNNNYNANSSNTWWIKPHVFVKNNTTYISFLITEKSIHYYINERFSNIKQRAWITYSVGSNDHELTFHSVYNWPTSYDMPRSWVPVSDSGDTLLVFQIGRVVKLEFSPVSGWVNLNTTSLDVRAYGIDSTGRIWLVNRGMASATQTGTTADNLTGTGYNSIYIYDPSSANQVTLSMDQSSYNFTGTTINSTLTVNATNSKELAEYGNAAVTTLNPFGDAGTSWSVTLDGTGDKIVAATSDDFNFYLDDFTVEFWLYSRVAWSSQTNLCGVVGHKTGDATQGWQIYRNSAQTNKLALRCAGTNDFYSTADVGTATWEHWALVRQGTILSWFKNGQLSGQNTSAGFNIYDYSSQFNIGFSQTWSVAFNGMISNLRIVKGLAVYTGNFTVPISDLTLTQNSDTNIQAINDNQVKFLGCKNSTIIDNAGAHQTRLNLRIIGDSIRFSGNNTQKIIETTNGTYSTPVSILSGGISYITATNVSPPYWITPSGPLQTALSGSAYSYQLLAAGDGELTYSVISGNLPAGISINSATGLISGTATDNALTFYSFSIRVADSGGLLQDRSYSLAVSTTADYSAEILVVGGGGAGQGAYYGGGGGGGGAGGILYTNSVLVTTGTTYPCIVGAGGAAAPNGGTAGNAGSDSSIAINNIVYTAFGGGRHDSNGGCSGGKTGPGGAFTAYTQTSQGPFTGYGSAGGNGSSGGGGAGAGGGGGGAGSAGVNAYSTYSSGCNGYGGAGGSGLEFSISGISEYYAGGGGGGSEGPTAQATGGLGGGGRGASACTGTSPGSGLPNTGGGGGGYGGPGGGSGTIGPGGSGGSGVIIIKYLGNPRASGGQISTVNGYTIHKFTSTDVFIA